MKFKIDSYFVALGLLVLLVSCTPKTADKIVDNVEEEVSSFRSQAPKSGEPKPVNMGEYTMETLDNGLKLIIVENHKLPLVNFQLSVDSPPILEVNGGINKTGYVGIAGALIAAGTATRSKADIDRSIDNLGASLSTSGRSATGQCLTKHIDSYLEIMSDVLMNPIFPEEEFEKAIKRTRSGIQSSQDDPTAIASRVRNVLVYGEDHPFGLAETNESVDNIELSDIKSYYKKTFYPRNSYLIIVGDISPEDAKMKAEEYFGKWKNPEAMAAYAPMPKPERPLGSQVKFVNKAGAVQSVINIAYPVNIKPGDEDAIKASVMNAILGGGVFSSKLIQNLREDKAYTYGARSVLDIDPYQGYFNAFASVRNEVTDSSVVEFLKEMNNLRQTPVLAEDLEVSKKFMIGTFARSVSNPSTVARLALNSAKYNLPSDYYQNYITNISKVTQDDVMQMAKKYVSPDNAYILVVGNKSEVADKLLRFDTDKKIDYYDAFGNYVKQAEEKIPDGHTAEIVISDYLDAIGGMKRIESIKDLSKVYTAELMGTQANFITKHMMPDMLLSEVSTEKMVMQKLVYDGKSVSKSGMQGVSTVTEGPEFNAAVELSAPFNQTMYNKPGFSIKLYGITQVAGKANYVVLVKKPDGKSATEYYDVKSGLLTKVVENLEAQEQSITLSTEYQDYKEVDGFMIPHKKVISGMMPTPFDLVLKEMKVNSGLTLDDFK